MKKNPKKLDLNKKPVKYAIAVREGRTKTESKIIAGYQPTTNTTKIERTKDFQTAVSFFKDELLAKTTMADIATALIDNIQQTGQDKIDRGARNKAIEIALAKAEPEQKTTTEEKVIVILSND